MSHAVLNTECIENNLVKEFRVYKDGQTMGYSFLPPFFLAYKFPIVLESVGTVVKKDILIIKNLKKLEVSETEIFAKK